MNKLIMIMTSILLFNAVEAFPPENLSIEEVRNIISGHAKLPDSKGTKWELDLSKQGSGWQSDKQRLSKCLHELRRKYSAEECT